MWPPSYKLVINPSKYLYFCTINHSENGLLWPTNRDDSWPHGGPTDCRWLVPMGHRVIAASAVGRTVRSSSEDRAMRRRSNPKPHDNFLRTPQQTPKRHDNLLPTTTAVRWWMRAVNYCQLWPGRGPNISACRPSTCEGWSVLQNPGGWVDQNVPLLRKWELAESGSYMTAAMLGMLGVTIYIFRKMAISWTINRDLIRSYVDATIYKSKIRWLYLLVIC